MKIILRLSFIIVLLSILPEQSFAQSYQTISKTCGNCHKPVSQFASVGQKCPKCGVIWGRENTSVNSNTMIVDVPSRESMENSQRSRSNSGGATKLTSQKIISNNGNRRRSIESTNRLNGFASLCGLNPRSTSQAVYNTFGKPTTIKESDGYEVWFYDLEKFSYLNSNKKVMFCFDATTQTLSSYSLVLDLYVSNSNQDNMKTIFGTFLKKERNLDLILSDKFRFQQEVGTPTETVIGEDAIFCSHVTDKIYISTQWRKQDYSCEMFQVIFDKRMWPKS